jgi:hypothetical protein
MPRLAALSPLSSWWSPLENRGYSTTAYFIESRA